MQRRSPSRIAASSQRPSSASGTVLLEAVALRGLVEIRGTSFYAYFSDSLPTSLKLSPSKRHALARREVSQPMGMAAAVCGVLPAKSFKRA